MDPFGYWVADRFTAQLNNRIFAANYQEFIGIHHKMATDYPEYHVAVKEMSTELDMRHGWANVLVFATMTGYPTGVNRQLVVMFKWRRSDRQWACTKVVTVRGGGRYDNDEIWSGCVH